MFNNRHIIFKKEILFYVLDWRNIFDWRNIVSENAKTMD